MSETILARLKINNINYKNKHNKTEDLKKILYFLIKQLFNKSSCFEYCLSFNVAIIRE